VHDGTLARRDDPVPPLPDIQRDGELHFVYQRPALAADASAMFGRSQYRIVMSLTARIEFDLPGGARRELWVTASPVDEGTCRVFWMHGRDDGIDGDDASTSRSTRSCSRRTSRSCDRNSDERCRSRRASSCRCAPTRCRSSAAAGLKELAEAEMAQGSAHVVGMLESVPS
jgi:hypothetical protein